MILAHNSELGSLKTADYIYDTVNSHQYCARQAPVKIVKVAKVRPITQPPFPPILSMTISDNPTLCTQQSEGLVFRSQMSKWWRKFHKRALPEGGERTADDGREPCKVEDSHCSGPYSGSLLLVPFDPSTGNALHEANKDQRYVGKIEVNSVQDVQPIIKAVEEPKEQRHEADCEHEDIARNFVESSRIVKGGDHRLSNGKG